MQEIRSGAQHETGLSPAGRSGSRFFRSDDMPGLELYRRSNVSRFVNRHVHMVFSLGITEAGHRVHHCGKGNFEAGPGCITLVNLDEAHSGGVERGQTYSCSTLRLSAELLRQLIVQITGMESDIIDIPEPVFRDDRLVHLVRRLLDCMEHPSSRLQRDELLLAILSLAISHGRRGTDQVPKSGHSTVSRVRDFLHDCYGENVTLDHLAAIAGLSAFHLSRLFAAVMGVPPHQYQMQIRLQRAKDLIASGQPLALVAQETGFFDQSHLHRAFQRQFGTTPGRYLR